MKAIRTTIAGKRWKIVRENLRPRKVCECPTCSIGGLCDENTRTITVIPEAKDADELYYLVHEHTHAAQPYLSEDAVVEISKDLAETLWGMGFRRVTV